MNELYTMNNNQLTTTVINPSRLFISIILFSISLLILISPIFNHINPFIEFTLPLSIGFILLIFIRSYASARLVISQTADKLEFEYKRQFLFNTVSKISININDIVLFVTDNKEFIQRIVTTHNIIQINNIRPIKKPFKNLIVGLTRAVKSNNGRIIDSKQDYTERGLYDTSLYIFSILTAFSIAIISRLWTPIGPSVLIILVMPVYALLRHIRLKVRKQHFIQNFKQSDGERKVKIGSYINQMKLLNENNSITFDEQLLSAIAFSQSVKNNPLHDRYYKELRKSVELLHEYVDDILESNFANKPVSVFINCLYEKVNHEYCVYLVNIKLVEYWYYIFNKLYQEIVEMSNNDNKHMIKEIKTTVKELAVRLNAI